MFKLWSQLNKDAGNELKPDFGLRSWGELSDDEKYTIWKHIDYYFFNKDIKEQKDFMGQVEKRYYEFYGKDDETEKKEMRIFSAIRDLNSLYKARNYAPTFLEYHSFNSACADFYSIFSQQSEVVVLELLSLYAKLIIEERKEKKLYKKEEETDEEYEARLQEWRLEEFDKFSQRINIVFSDFGLNTQLTRLGFTPKQDEIIEQEIYDPVLKKFSHEKWKPVNRELSDSLEDYRKNDYSGSITHSISAVQAFLQLLVHETIGKGDISKLIPEAQKKKLIPDDQFSSIIFKDIESFLAQERQHKGDPHPKKEYAIEKNARIVLNLAMVFFNHCI